MRRVATGLLLTLLSPLVLAAAGGAGGNVVVPEFDVGNTAALQRGAKYFTNYCLSCHSAQYMRYSHLVDDLGLNEKLVEENLLLPGHEIGDRMTVAMTQEDGEQWFVNPPPDLTLVARSQGPGWVYRYLQTFYLDDTRPFGVNNLVLPGAVMPHVLGHLQGWQEPVYETVVEQGEEKEVLSHLELVQEGALTPEEYDRVVRDLVTFLVYLAEPAKLQRSGIGLWVVLFLTGLLVLVYFLKKEYWKDLR